ncbi:MAG TPA: lipoprotein [Xanthobacteraceae bacterium]
MRSSFHPRLPRIALIGALVAALGLAGCGRKGGLDLPPSAAAAIPNNGAQPGTVPPGGPNGQPPAPTEPPPLPKHTPIDWLID